MATSPAPDVLLDPLTDEARPIEDWLTTFHLVLVALDPYTHESAWLIDTAGRILRAFTDADCRVGWLVTANDEETERFLGPWAAEMLAFSDPERNVVRSLGLETMPAIVHIDLSLDIVGSAEGWNPNEWRDVATGLADAMDWNRPT
ncbi:MAG: hypothetical protein ACR2PK_16195, partial [Acidimicrobiales bacterium]